MKHKEAMQKAQREKDPEFYTLYEDIAQEIPKYKEQLRGKRIICPCDWDESYNEELIYKEEGVTASDLFISGSIKHLDLAASKDKFEKDFDAIKCQFVKFFVFYLWKNKDGILEVLDGKQRIHAITRFYENDLQYDNLLWKELNSKRPELQKKINDTELSIIVCEGEEEHKREIFSRINTLGVPLSPFEVLNGLYAGEYLRGLSRFVEADKDARKVLGANSRGKNQMKVLDFICSLKQIKNKKEYVKQHADLPFEDDQMLVTKHFRFVASVFDDYGSLPMLLRLAVKYRKDIAIWKSKKTEINKRLKAFRKSQDYKLVVDKEKETEDIIQAIVNGISVDPKRFFTSDDRKQLCEEALQDPARNDGNGKILCAGGCGQYFLPDELTVDHKEAWSLGGRTELSNAELLCRACNSKKGNR